MISLAMPKLQGRLKENYSYISLKLSMINRQYCQYALISPLGQYQGIMSK